MLIREIHRNSLHYYGKFSVKPKTILKEKVYFKGERACVWERIILRDNSNPIYGFFPLFFKTTLLALWLASFSLTIYTRAYKCKEADIHLWFPLEREVDTKWQGEERMGE